MCPAMWVGVVQEELEVTKEYVIFGADGEGGDEVGDEVAEFSVLTRWPLYKGYLDGCTSGV